MSKFYEILQKLKENRKPKKKREFVKIKKFHIFFFLALIFTGLTLSFLTYYIKSYVKSYNNKKNIYSEVSKTLSLPPINETYDFSNKTLAQFQTRPKPLPSLKPQVLLKSKEKLEKMSSPKTKELSFSFEMPKTEIKAKNLGLPYEESPEGFILKKEDLLNNLLILAEEERKSGNCEKAIFYYLEYLKERITPSVMNNYSACLIELKRFDEAIEVLNKTLAIKNDPEIRYNLAIAYFLRGDKEKACKEIKNLNLKNENIKKLEMLCGFN